MAEGEAIWAILSAVLDDGVLNEAFFMCWEMDLLVRCLETLSFLERLPPETLSFLDRLPAEMLSWRLRLENMVDVRVWVWSWVGRELRAVRDASSGERRCKWVLWQQY